MNILLQSQLYLFLVDLKDPTFSLLVLLLILIFLFIIFASIFIVLMPKLNSKPKVDNNIRIYTYDYAKKSFTYFDKMNLKKQRVLTEKQFLDQFKASDRYRVQDWLKDISQGK